MIITKDTSSYNERRYGKPYIAKIDFTKNVRGDITWGDWIGTPGFAGMLQIEVKPGDVVMRGQKDNRGSNGTPVYGFVESEQSVKWGLNKINAYKMQIEFHNKEGNK